MAPLSRVLVAGSVTGPSRLNAAARRGRAGLPYSHPFSVRCGAPATTEPRVGAFANSLSLLPLQSGSESELQAQLDWLSESNQVAVVVSQQGLPRLGFFSEDENAWGHAEVAMWGDLRVQFVTTLSSVTHMLSRARRSSRTRRAASPRRLCEVSFTGMAVFHRGMVRF